MASFCYYNESHIPNNQSLKSLPSPLLSSSIKTTLMPIIKFHKESPPNPFIIESNKHDYDSEEDDDEFKENQTITDGKNAKWVVNGSDICDQLTQYQLEKKIDEERCRIL